jgi:hypothetical protein
MLKLVAIVVVYRLLTARVTWQVLKYHYVHAHNQQQIDAIRRANSNDMRRAQQQIDAIFAAHGVWPGIVVGAVLLDLLSFALLALVASWLSLFHGNRFLWVANLAAPSVSLAVVWVALCLGRRGVTHSLLRGATPDRGQIRGMLFLGIGIVVIIGWLRVPAYLVAYGLLSEVVLLGIFLAFVLKSAGVPFGATGARTGATTAGHPAPSPPKSPSSAPGRLPGTPYGAPPGSAFGSPGATAPKATSPPAGSPPGHAASGSPTPAKPCTASLPAGNVSITSNPIPTRPSDSACATQEPMDLQAVIDSASAGETVVVQPAGGRVEGPVVITKAITIEGSDSILWATAEPVMTIAHGGVTIRNLGLQITSQVASLAKGCALRVTGTTDVSLRNVVLYGEAEGVPGETGVWRHPGSLDLGSIQAGRSHEFKLRLAVPVACSMTSEISGLMTKPQNFTGLSEITLHLDALPPGTRLRGHMALKTSRLVHCLVVRANVTADDQLGIVGSGQIVYQPDDWSILLQTAAEKAEPKTTGKASSEPPSPLPGFDEPDASAASVAERSSSAVSDESPQPSQAKKRKVVRGGGMGLFEEKDQPKH